MKLRNKETGEIGYLYEHSLMQDIIIVYDAKGIVGKYNSLAELNEDWEDYEKPKEYWYLDSDGDLLCEPNDDRSKFDNNCREIGNYFLSREEAEKAVKKLKAVKRLKDKGFKLKGWYMPKNILKIEINGGFPEDTSLYDIMDDLDNVFGGEE